MKAFVQYLLEHPDTFRDQVGRHIEEFFEQTKTVLAAGEIQHAARNFGLVYAAGRLAIAARILPWNRTVLRKAILACFCDGYSLIPKYKPLEAAAARILREKLRQISLPVKEKHGIDPGDKIGFVTEIGNVVQFTIRSTTFRDCFPDRMHLSA
ncbi:hypothetical protein FPV16_16770 [Methylobacterium sp. W2]|uniref:hypothetical protein n=1 Tax=Methylobacterium sp. W2 TaxID=2598107 RepID=UPI001D0C95E9|nr:hypothetical protein [Methylobacterium sp. W2]MCC0807858.1 hypothetical protein [Methylobacterium sp. W2]